MSILGGELVLDLLQSHGVENIFCSPGSEWTPMWEGLLRRYDEGNQSIRYFNCRHETLAVTMAMGYTKATNRTSAVLLHTGVGTLNAAMSIRAAYMVEAPMIIFSGETYNHVVDKEIRIAGPHWITHISDVGGPAALVKPYVKWSNTVYTIDNLIDSIHRGYQIANEYPRGPVMISFTRELLMKATESVNIKPPAPLPSLPQPPSQVLEDVAQRLIEAKQPIILTEHIGRNPENVAKLVELAELLSIPVFQTAYPTAINFPQNHPLHMGYDSSEAIKEADMIMAIGCLNPWYTPSQYSQNSIYSVLIDANTSHRELPYWGFQFDVSLSADVGSTLTTLIDIIKAKIQQKGQSPPLNKEKLEKWQNKHDQMVQQWTSEALAGEKNKPISSKWLLHTINKVLPSNSAVMEEVILHSRVMHKYLTTPEIFAKSTTGGLGVGMGEALGIKLAHPDKPVIFIVGDGAFTYNPVLAALGLSQEYNLPFLTIVLNNGGYMVMKLGFNHMYPSGWASTHNKYLGVDIAPDPDYSKIAEAYGAYGEKVDEPGNIEAAMKRALQQLAEGRSALLDIVADKGKFPF